MKCHNCESKKDLKKSLRTVNYDECGMDNIVIKDVRVYSCENCGHEYFQYGNIVKLHEIIFKTILDHVELLTGAQAKFLRKQIGASTKRFADLLQANERTVMRWESQSELTSNQTAQVKNLVRLIEVCRNYDDHDLVTEKQKKQSSKNRFTFTLANKGFELSFA